MFSWFDSYDIYAENGETEFVVKGEFSWGKCLRIYDKEGYDVGMIKQKLFTLTPRYEIYYKNSYVGLIYKEFSFFKPRFTVDFNGWTVEGNFVEWDYTIRDERGDIVASICKDIWQWTDSYVLNISREKDALDVLMLALAIDADKDRRSDSSY